MKQRNHIFDRLTSLEAESDPEECSKSAKEVEPLVPDAAATQIRREQDLDPHLGDANLESVQPPSTAREQCERKDSQSSSVSRKRKRAGRKKTAAAISDNSGQQKATTMAEGLTPISEPPIASADIPTEIKTMTDPKPSRRSKNIFESPILDGSENEVSRSENEMSVAADSMEQLDSPVTRVVKQKDAVLGVPDIQGERLGEGEILFAPEVDDFDTFGDSESSVDPSVLAARFNWMLVSFFTIIVAAFVLVALSQTATLAREIGNLPFPGNWIGFVSLGILWLAIGFATLQLVSGLVRLKKTPGVSLSALKMMQDRAENRKWHRENQKVAETAVRDFLRQYPSNRNQVKLLENAGFGRDSITVVDFFERIEQLMRTDNGLPDQWLEDVRSRIVLPMEAAATRIIKRVSMQVGAATAISPRGSVDSLIVLAQSYRLVNELCQLYGVRPGGLETCYILGQSLLSVAIAAGGDQAADKVEEQVRETLQNTLGVAAGSVAAKVGTRVGEGTVNAMFVRRIGNRLKKNLCPVTA
jgi:uncharacterized membrane protein YcjF (UPF0283 family)